MATTYHILRRVLEALAITRTPLEHYCPPTPGEKTITLILAQPLTKDDIEFIEKYVENEYRDVKIEYKLLDRPILHIYIPSRRKLAT